MNDGFAVLVLSLFGFTAPAHSRHCRTPSNSSDPIDFGHKAKATGGNIIKHHNKQAFTWRKILHGNRYWTHRYRYRPIGCARMSASMSFPFGMPLTSCNYGVRSSGALMASEWSRLKLPANLGVSPAHHLLNPMLRGQPDQQQLAQRRCYRRKRQDPRKTCARDARLYDTPLSHLAIFPWGPLRT